MLDNSNMQTILSEIAQSTAQKEINFPKVIEDLFGIMLMLLPIFFIPFTADAFSLNKTYLVLFVSIISLMLFFAEAVVRKRLQLLTPGAYLGMFLFLLGGVASTYFSVNRHVSVFGYFGNYESSLLFLFALFVIGFVASNVKLNVTRLSLFFLIGVTLSTFVSFLAMYGVKIPGIGSVPVSFSLAGGTNVLAALQVLSVLMVFYHLGNRSKSDGIKENLLYGIILVLNLVYMLVALNILAVSLVVLAILYLILSSNLDIESSRTIFLPLSVITILLVFVHYFPVTRSFLGLKDYTHSFRLPITESWLVSVESVRDFPFTGSGIATFVSDFTRYRPASLNVGSVWEARFAYPFNDVFLWLATAGLVGLFLYATFWVFVVKDILYLSRGNKSKFIIALMLGVVFMGLMLLGFNIALYVFLFILLGIVSQDKQYSRLTISVKNGIVFLGVISVAAFGLLGYNAYGVYAAQFNFMNSLLTNNALERYELQRKSLQMDPKEAIYRRVFIDTSLFIARQLSQAEKPTETDISQIQQLVAQAVNDARLLTEVINPLDVANWEVRGQVYDALAGVAERSDEFAAAAYTNAINLESTNPRLWINLGSVYYRQKDYQNSIQSFARSVQLKNDYANAHYNLAFALKDWGDPFNAVIQLEIVSRLVPVDSPDFEKVSKELEEFRKEAEKVRAQQAEIERQKAENLPEGQNPEGVVRQAKLAEPLSRPQDDEQNQIDSNISVPDEVINPEAPLAQPPVE